MSKFIVSRDSNLLNSNEIHNTVFKTDYGPLSISYSAEFLLNELEEIVCYSNSKVFVGMYDGVDIYDIHGVSGVSRCYSSARKRDILLIHSIKCPPHRDAPDTIDFNVFKSSILSYKKDSLAQLPAYIQIDDKLFPVCGCGELGKNLIIIKETIENNKPSQILDTYLIRICKFSKYGETTELYTCNSFEAANQMILDYYDSYRANYYIYDKPSFDDNPVPNNKSNSWIWGMSERWINISIINLKTNELAKYPEGYC